MDFYQDIRGFNYQPSYEANGYAIWRNFKPLLIDHELALGKQYFPKMNAVRLWLSWDAFLRGVQIVSDYRSCPSLRGGSASPTRTALSYRVQGLDL